MGKIDSVPSATNNGMQEKRNMTQKAVYFLFLDVSYLTTD